MEKTIENLSTILNVYANFDAELGYCQGLLFLVGVLYYHFQNDSPALTFHSLVVIMQSELELRDIFTASTMSTELNNWLEEFLQILEIVDVELFNHLLQNVGIEFQVFLFQWWLSFISSHIPDLSIINRIIDVCLTQGWKVGLFKISLGLLLVNKPILMTFEKGDEEVIYQHLLNESRWGIAVNDLDLFFGKTLMSWDDVKLFTKLNEVQENMFIPPLKGNGHARTSSNIIDTFKQLSITLGRTRSNSDNANISPQSASSSTSSLSVFSADTGSNGNGAIRSRNSELESIYSDLTSTHSDEKTPSLPAAATGGASGLFSNYLKFPYNHSSPSKSENESLIEENKNLKELLREALDMIEKGERNEMIVHEIKGVIG